MKGDFKMSFKEIAATELKSNPFQMIGKDWLLVTAEKNGKCNTMTASWGGVGVIWGKNVAYIFIRPQRYTKEFIDGSDTLSLSVLDNSFRKTLNYLGTASGRDEDKIAKAGLNVVRDEETPYFQEADTVLICRKMYAQELKPECFIDDGAGEKWNQQKDYHTMYECEIQKVMVKSDTPQ